MPIDEGVLAPIRQRQQTACGTGRAISFAVGVMGARARSLDVSARIRTEARLRDRRDRHRQLSDGDEKNRRSRQSRG